MSEVKIAPAENILDSLRNVSSALESIGTRQVWALKEILTWSWHALALLFYLRVYPERSMFDDWFQDYFHEWGTEIDVDADSRREEREHLGILPILDLLSEQDLPSLKLDFYAGWRDRVARCRELRARIQQLTRGCVNSDERDVLLFLLASHNRLQRAPVEIRLPAARILAGFPVLLNTIRLLWDPDWPAAQEIDRSLQICRDSVAQG